MQRYLCKLPDFLAGMCSQEQFNTWLMRKTRSILRRDRKRGNTCGTYREYKLAIYRAVVDSSGNCAYTGKLLRWDLISMYDNKMAKLGGRKYQRMLYEVPTIDHVSDGLGVPDFRICSWVVNSCKNQLGLQEFLMLCRQILEFHGEKVSSSKQK